MLDPILWNLFVPYMITGIFYSTYHSVIEVRKIIKACEQDAADIDENTTKELSDLADLENMIGTHSSLLLYCLITFINNLPLILKWLPIVLNKKNKPNQ